MEKEKQKNNKPAKEEKPNKRELNIKIIFSILGIFVFWRLVLQMIAFLGTNRLKLTPDTGYGGIIPWNAPILDFLKHWIRWDSGYYLDIASKGYYFDQAKDLFNTTFFPLYPILINGLNFIFLGNNFYTGLFISTVSTLVACFFIYKLAKIDLNEKAALRSVFYFLIFPTAVFLATIYTESLFIMLSAASLYFARKNKWLYSGIFGFFVALTRPQGIILFPILILEYLEQRNFKFKKIKFNLIYTLFVPLGLSTYMYYLNYKFGNPFLFISAQNSWGRNTNFSLGSIWDTLSNYFYDFFYPGTENFAFYIVKDMDLLFFLIFLVLSVVIFFKFRMSYGFYILLSLLMPFLTNTLLSVGRFTLVFFPAFIFLSKISKNQAVQYGITMLFLSLFTVYTILFVNWHWAG